MQGKRAVIILFCAIAWQVSADVQAVPITFAFEAISQFDERPFREFVPGMIARGTYTFESTTPLTPISPQRARYENTVTSFSVEIEGIGGGQNISSGAILVDNSMPVFVPSPGAADEYVVDYISMAGFSVGGFFGPWSLIGAELTFVDRTETATTGFELPLVPPSLEAYADSHVLRLNFMLENGETSATDFVVTSLTLIPEPSTYALAAIGVVGLLAFRRRK